MAKKTKVVPSNVMHTRRLMAMMHADTDPTGLFDIPYDDIRRVAEASNESLSDIVTLGPRAQAAVRRLFDAFGIVGIPAVWGELAGAIAYCDMLDAMVGGPRNSFSDAAAITTMQSNCPELVPSVRALQKKDMDALREISRTTLPLSVMSLHFDAEQECWVPQSMRRAG